MTSPIPSGKAWTVRDRYGNEIYLTWERWSHVIDPDNHAEVEPFFDYMAETVRLGRRRQDIYDVTRYQYDYLSVNLSLNPQTPPLPERVIA